MEFFPSNAQCQNVTSGSKEVLEIISHGLKHAHPTWIAVSGKVKATHTHTHNMGKFSSFLIYSRKNIKHSENIFHIFKGNSKHFAWSPAAEFFNRSIDSMMLYMHNYKNKTYKKEDI